MKLFFFFFSPSGCFQLRTANSIKFKKKDVQTSVQLFLTWTLRGGVTSALAKGPLATGHCSNDCSLSALETEINPGGSKGGLRAINASASGRVSGLWRRRARPPLWTDGEIEDAGRGRSPGRGGSVLSRAGRLGSAQPRPCQPARLGADAQNLAFSHSSLFSAISNVVVFFQTKLHGGENPVFSAVSGSRLLTEGLAPRSAHQPPSKVHGCSKLDPSLPTRSDRYPSLRQPPPQKMTLKHLNTGFFALLLTSG